MIHTRAAVLIVIYIHLLDDSTGFMSK
jgi:hypothetical protein